MHETTLPFTAVSTEATTPITTFASEEPVTTEESETTAAPTETAARALVEEVYSVTGEFMGIALSYSVNGK